MEPANILLLPVEIIHQISKYLRVQDVLSCSQTCHYLRYALNDNSVWKRHLPEQDLSRLATEEQQVQPAFQLRPQDCLTPLCGHRVHYMRKTHLLNNWRNGRFKPYKMKGESPSYSGDEYIFSTGKGRVFYNDRYLFIRHHDLKSDAIKVWDVNEVPELYTSLDIKNMNCRSFYIVETNLVVVGLKVHVYKITIPEKEFPLKYSFSVTEADSQHHLDYYSYSVVDQYLLALENQHDCAQRGCVLHVWDIVNASKLGSFPTTRNGVSITFHSKTESGWIFEQELVQSLTNNYCLCCFNVEKRQFSQSVLKFQGRATHIMFHESTAIVFKEYLRETSYDNVYDSFCVIYDFSTSKEVKKRRFNNSKTMNLLTSTVVVNGTFVLLCDGWVQTIDAKSLKTVDSFQYFDDFKYVSRQFNVFGSVFIVLSSYIDRGLEIWDITRKRKVDIDVRDVDHNNLYLNDLGAKLVCVGRKELRTLHFW